MSLKVELQKLTNERVLEVNRRLQERLDSISQEELKSETIVNIENYPAINGLALLATEQAFADGQDIDSALQRGIGASHVLLVLTTIAELDELPVLH